jgi:hypothetical protein
MDVFWSILSGVLLLIVSQLLIRFIFEPVQELWKAIGVVSHALIFYANVYSNPELANETLNSDARRQFREAASLLRSRALVIPFYDQIARFQMVPSRAAIRSSSSSLIGLSNNLDRLARNDKRIEAIANNLNLVIDESEGREAKPITIKKRIAVVISAVWIIAAIIIAIGISYRASTFLQWFLLIGMMPLVIGWGIWWITKR